MKAIYRNARERTEILSTSRSTSGASLAPPNVLFTLFLTTCCPLALATEGGAGRPLTGQQIYSNAGVIPPEPGWVMSLTSIYYNGDLKGGRQVPILGELSAGLDMELSYTMANFTRVWDTGKGRWNFASAIGVPVQYANIKADLTGPRGRSVNSPTCW